MLDRPSSRADGASAKPSATATMGTDAPDHFREPRNVTAGTVRDTEARFGGID